MAEKAGRKSPRKTRLWNRAVACLPLGSPHTSIFPNSSWIVSISCCFLKYQNERSLGLTIHGSHSCMGLSNQCTRLNSWLSHLLDVQPCKDHSVFLSTSSFLNLMSRLTLPIHTGFSWTRDAVCFKVPTTYGISDIASVCFIFFLSWFVTWACERPCITGGAVTADEWAGWLPVLQ